MFDYDAELRQHNLRLRAAAAVGPHDRVLDIGCGGGQTTREAAEAAVNGSAVGVDISPRLLEQARARSAGLPNVAFEQADAQVHPFQRASFDVCISRFGTMFFADPVAAFSNIALALRPGARLVLLVWQDADRNEWSTVVRQALSAPAKAGPNAFSLADPTATEKILTAAGFTGIGFTDVREPVYYGPDTAAAYHAILELQQPTGVLAALDPATADEARARLRAAVAARETADGVFFDSRAWLITARRDDA
ncbi:methyltransferase family protein [Asanoa ferruginea]|uniref:Methyltransferase family protein n=1 Tax=Asanoa ferruginea TaxID=53367 RepID=A0A3D9ZUE7_9ACTN|nr:class I SAM-dependent methyltransferase [Asanoa ferruginea]REG00550.1 methyltransferase family protein [Asanoa ferruginea]GIF47713.1 methyltransferase [Asanoa ferruginea]